MMVEYAVILPTYNEKGNLRAVVEAIGRAMSKVDYEIWVVDDNSPDKTYEEARSLAKEFPIHLIRRPKKMGLASAVVTGFLSSSANKLICMDSDGQHDARVLPVMINMFGKGADIIVGSRFLGDVSEEWGQRRNLMSKVATALANPFTKIKDPMSGCFAVKRELVEQISRWEMVGYKILLEILVKSPDAIVYEVPIHFGARQYGSSKLNWREVWRYLLLLWRLFLYKVKNKQRPKQN